MLQFRLFCISYIHNIDSISFETWRSVSVVLREGGDDERYQGTC